MTFCLYECLRAVGLQQHYARFTSKGVCRLAQLSELTTEDCSHLGICSMEERTRLIDLVQLIKSFDLDTLGSDEDDSCNSKAAAAQDVECYAIVNQQFYYGGSGNRDDHVSDDENEASAGLSYIRRRLDFSIDSTDCRQKQSSCPGGSVHDSSTQRRAPAMPVQLHHGKPVVCNSKRNKFKPDIYSFPSDHHLEENFNPRVTRGISMHNSNPKPSSSPVSSKTFKNTTFGPRNRKGISRKQGFCLDMKSTGSFGCMAKPTPVFKAKRAASYNYGLPLSVPVTPNKRRVGKPRITVCVRKRPLTSAENRRKEVDVVTTPSGETVIIHESKDAVDLSQYILEHSFYFNHVFGEGSSNEDVYQNTAYPLVQHMLNGGNATCFAYGQTGAGKTHTMLGSPGRPGLYALAVRDIFTHLSTTRTHPSPQVLVSFFEIYCGQLYDLLNHRKRLFARENGQKVVDICGLRHVRVDSVNSLMEVISHGTETRTQGSSGVNPSSSRSHALLQIQLRNSNQQITGRMWFVDLAGSERASDTKEPDKQSRMEGAEINQSLLALKECIRALDREQSHTPFRQSKLTQVLKTAFIGDSMTCMIANISPGHGATEHTLNTLRYADRVKELKGQGGLRERRGSKAVPSPKHNLPNSNSSRGSVGPSGKSILEKPNLEKQKADLSSNPQTTTLHQRDTILSSKPKNRTYGKEANVTDSKETGLKHITTIRMLLDVGEKSNRTTGCGGKKSRRTENRRSSSQSVHDQGFREGPVLGQQIDKQLDLWVLQKEKAAHQDYLSFTKRQLELDHSEKVNQQLTVTKGSVEDRKWMELRRQVASSRDTNSKAEKKPKRGFQDVDSSYEERKMHLRRYHEELQKFTPSSFHLEPPSTQTSFSSSVSTSFTHHSSSFSVSTNECSGMEEYLDTYAARGRVREANRGQLQEVHSQSAAAERPLSPAREQTGKFQTSGKFTDIWPEFNNAECNANAVSLPLQNSSEATPSNRHSKKKTCFVTNAKTLNKLSKTPTQTKEPETTVLPQNDAADSFSCIMAPFGISLLQVDRQPATTSYLRGENSNGSRSGFGDECGEDRMRETGKECPTYKGMEGKIDQYEDEDFPLSFLELPQIKPCIPNTSDSREATTQTEPSEICKLDKTEPLKVSKDFLQDQEHCQKPQMAPTLGSKDPAFPHKHFTCTSLQTPIMQPAVQHFVNTSLLTLQARPNTRELPSKSPHNDFKKALSLMSTPQPENISSQLNIVPSQCQTITSDYDRLSDMSFHPNKTAASLGEEDRSYQNLFILDDLNHAKWCVVKAYWEQLREMEVLCQNGGTLLRQQPDMAFGEYIHKLEEILEKKAQCLHSMRAQLQPYLKLINHNHLQQQQ